MKITLITHNPHKVKIARQYIPELEHHNVEMTEIQHPDYKEVVKHKLEQARQKIKGTIIVDDAGISFSALNGHPEQLLELFLIQCKHTE